jgi:Domain of unknown function (DUF4190)
MTQPPPNLPPDPTLNYGYLPGRRHTSGAAVASLIFGIIGCIPYLTGILAIVFGVMGIRRTRDPMSGGRGLAIAGLILGIISIVGWTCCGGLMAFSYEESKPAGVIATKFVMDLCAGNISAAVANSQGFTAAQLQTLHDQLAKSMGAYQSISLTSFNMSWMNGVEVMRLGGTCMLGNNAHPCTFSLVKMNGTYKVTQFWVQ